jgi:hypothetical protein
MASTDDAGDIAHDDPIDATLAATLEHHVDVEHPPNVRPVTRDAHPKAHGCVYAIVTVDGDLKAPYKSGVFEPGRRYQAWIRFSNALKLRHDLVKDARGMAVKLLGVEGDNETPGCTSQDFLLVTHPAFFVANAREYVDFPATVFRAHSAAALYLRVAGYFFGVSPRRFRWRGAWALWRSLKWTSSPLVIPYFSQAPFRFGPHGEAKFCARPRQGPGFWRGLQLLVLALAYQVTAIPGASRVFPFTGSTNLLRDALWRSLRQGPAAFDLLVQLRTDAKHMPIDDATVRWSERHSPYRRIATIEIPTDQPDPKLAMQMAEHLTFSPWHCLTAHQPQGSINRARRSVYRRIAALRHGRNAVRHREPLPQETVEAYLAAIGALPERPPGGGE